MTAVNFDDRPDDAGARERIRVDLDSTLFVQAAAGSGKTNALVARVTALIDEGRAELREIAAISFTEAAAAELRGRVAASLANDTTNSDHPLLPRRRAGALLQLDEAAMTTIHGFAQRLLAEHPIEAGLPLRFDVADELVASVVRTERFEGFIDRLFDDPAAGDLLQAATLLGIGVESIRALSGQIGERVDGLDLPPEPTVTIPELVRERFTRIRRSAMECLTHSPSCTNDEDLLLGRLIRLAGALDAAGTADDWLAALEWIAGLPAERKARVGQRGSWRGEGIESVRASLVEYERERVDALGAMYDAVLVGLGRQVLVEAAAFATERRRAGSLFFHDLLLLARNLLLSHPAVRAELRERYRYVLVDEFQDTDPLQFEILTLLGTPPGGTSLEPGRLFFVGDPMQSIYRFRGADVALYRSVREFVGPDGIVNLTTNFRSAPAICAFVSSTFSNFVVGGDRASIHLKPHRGEHDGPRVWSLGGASADLRATDRRAIEANEIVGAITSLVRAGVPVATPNGPRPVRFGDVAVLVPVRTGLGALLGAFDRAGIDVRLAESSLIYASEEAQAVIAVLRAIDDRGDDRDVVAALRTSLFSLSDGELRHHVEEGGSWDLSVASDAARPGAAAVLAGLGFLREMRDEARTLGPVGTLVELLERRHVREIVACSPHGADAIERIEFLIDRARACRDGGGRTLAELLAFFAIERRVGVRVVNPLTGEDDPDAVRISTVHGAKGLEFPVVVLAELGGPIGTRPRPPALLVDDRRVEINLGAARATAGYDELANAEAEAARSESIRLAYVAATRARDYLIVSLHHRPKKEKLSSLAALIESVVALPPAPHDTESTDRQRAEPIAPGTIERSGFDAAVSRWNTTMMRAAVAPSVSPSGLDDLSLPRSGRERAGSGGRRTVDPDGDGIDWRRARASSSIGRAVHAVLQRIDLDSPTGLDALAAEFCEIEGCTEFVRDVESLVVAATRSPIVIEAAHSPMLCRELPLTFVTPDGFVEGVADLCFESSDGLVIVDYKTDLVADRTEAFARAERYRLQAGAYASAVGAITAQTVARVVFLFLAPPDGSIEVEVADVSAAIADADRAIARAMARDGAVLDHDRGR